jgi:serine/threonine protein kinase
MSEDAVGTRKGDYEIQSVLGTGGMGKVYKVRNVLSDRIEAMKVLLPNLADQKDLADRFLREIKVLASLSHPNIAALRTALMIDNQLVMIMEYIEGTTMSARVEQGAIPLEEALNYISQVLSALSYAHKQQIVHRDIKPANMMLTPEAVIKLMDFGIARSGPDMGLTMTGTTLGSLSYMSPEQVKCGPVDARSDLYSLGVSLYEMVTGERPFQADSHFSILQAHLRELPKPPVEINPELPVAVSEIILMAMEKEPAKRFQSADAFLNAVQSVAANLDPGGSGKQSASAAPSSPGTEAAGRKEATVLLNQNRGSRVAPGSPAAAEDAAAPVPQLGATKYRGLYIGLGALIVVLVLVAAGISAPNWLKTKAKDSGSFSSKDASSKPAASTPSLEPVEPASVPASTGSAAEPASGTPSSTSTEPSQPASNAEPATKNAAAFKSHAVAPEAPRQADNGASAQPPQPDPAQLEELDHEMDLLSSREIAIGSGLDHLQKQMSAQGLNLRGDILAAQARMRMNLGKAQAALQAHDAEKARKYLDLVAPDAEKIEKFLGH